MKRLIACVLLITMILSFGANASAAGGCSACKGTVSAKQVFTITDEVSPSVYN